jgi:hypothetical protein
MLRLGLFAFGRGLGCDFREAVTSEAVPLCAWNNQQPSVKPPTPLFFLAFDRSIPWTHMLQTGYKSRIIKPSFHYTAGLGLIGTAFAQTIVMTSSRKMSSSYYTQRNELVHRKNVYETGLLTSELQVTLAGRLRPWLPSSIDAIAMAKLGGLS